jgi:alpha,alpha-trehalose-phosphate synthase [UDP-forming]/trehalose-phosphatase
VTDLWLPLLRHSPLAILTDLDGTILPFASTPDAARPTAELRALVEELATTPGVTLIVVSGRPRTSLDEFFPLPRSALLVAEHGAWRSANGWESTLSVDPRAVDSLQSDLARLLAKYPMALLERKTWALALHFRRVAEHRKAGLLVQAASVLGPWLEAHPDFERLAGSEVLEIRPRLAHKASAVAWARERLGAACRLVIVGDDVTDEDMFAAAGEGDAAILVSAEPPRPTRARYRLRSIEQVLAFYRAVLDLRRASSAPAASALPTTIAPRGSSAESAYHLLVVSNRLPELRSVESSLDPRKQSVGGLVSALRPVLARRKGIWLGWSGRTRQVATPTDVELDEVGGLALAWVDFPEEWQRRYYNGLSNGALWPLFHSFPGRVKFSHADWQSYEQANDAFAAVASTLVGKGDTIWVHDYHLLLLGKDLRERGHRGRIGFFQHIPFPGPDIFFLLPWATEVLTAMLEFDLVGFHTESYVANFLRCMASLPGALVEGNRVLRGERAVTARAFPLGIIPDEFQDPGNDEASAEVVGLVRAIGSSRLVLGVDRLDYTKGIPERIDAFGQLLAQFPEWRRNVCLVQVSVPSRADIAEYAEQRTRVENSVGRINGEFGEADWVPIRYLYRSYGRSQLSQLYRLADVGYVTPLRDGMNLVAKEYVAAQDPAKPGVLLLSRFAGAAEELRAALQTNPWDPEGTARDLDRALRMPLEERLERHAALHRIISKTTALTWAEDFLAALEAVTPRLLP